MKADIKVQWLDALRSGKYQQGQSFLNAGGKMCCLGVLCDIVNPKQWHDDGAVKTWGPGHAESIPTVIFLKRVGLDVMVAQDLAAKNDDGGYSFTEIADYIEREL